VTTATATRTSTNSGAAIDRASARRAAEVPRTHAAMSRSRRVATVARAAMHVRVAAGCRLAVAIAVLPTGQGTTLASP